MGSKSLQVTGVIAFIVLLTATMAYALSETKAEVIRNLWTFEKGISVTGGPVTLPADQLKQSWNNRRFILEEFESNPATSLVAGGVAGGTTGNTNVMAFEDNNFEYHIKGTQTITAPSLAASGLNITMDLTDNDGVEISNGITARSRAAYVIGTDAFYFKAGLKITDVSGTDDCAVGFRTAEAYQADIDNYNNMAVLNVISGDIYIETIDDNAATTSTDTTANWADAGSHTLEVYVDVNGVVTYRIDGSAPATTAAFTWDDGDTVVPFFYFLNATDIAETTYITSWECGLQ